MDGDFGNAILVSFEQDRRSPSPTTMNRDNIDIQLDCVCPGWMLL
jgi:hypothetical protein